jgi:putative ABC transport system permease protein
MTGARLPVGARWVLRWLVPAADREEVLRDLADEYEARRRGRGRVRAWLWLWRQVTGSVPWLVGRRVERARARRLPAAGRRNGGGSMLDNWIMDGRYALRRLVRRPAYAVLAVLTLALGVGGTAAAFGIVRSLLLTPLPYGEVDRLVAWWMPYNWAEEELSFLRPETPGHESIAIYAQRALTMRVGDAPARIVEGVRASAELFDVLGVRPALGPGFRPGDDALNAAPVVVLSHGLWRELGGTRELIGSSIVLEGESRTIVGVMAEGFWFPAPTVRAWVPVRVDPANGSGNYAVVGRLAEGLTLDAMAAPLARITTSLAERFEYVEAWDNTKDAQLTPLADYLLAPVRPALLATLAAMGLILLIACANVAALMLAHVSGRAGELGTRAALGAGRARLAQQLVVEGVAVGLCAGIAGAVLAIAAFDVLTGALPLGSLAASATLDWTVVAFALGSALAASVAVAAVPAWSVWRSDLRAAVVGARTGGVLGRGSRIEGGLVVAEVALAVVMAASAALLIRSVSNLVSLDPGIDTRGIAVVDVTLPGAGVEWAERNRMIVDVTRELGALPGVAVAGAVQKLPLRQRGDNWGFTIPGRPDVTGVWTAFRVVSPEYFEAVGIEVVRGRGFEASDRTSAERLVVINEAMAARFFPNEDPIGRLLSTGFETPERIVGIVETVQEGALTDEPAPARYMLYEHVGTQRSTTFVLRARPGANVAALLDDARGTIQRVAPDVAVQATQPMQSVFAQAIGPALQLRTLLALLAALALLLGGIGVYGVVSHHVARRRRDWSIRLALGLEPRQVVARVVARGTTLVAAGAAVGVLGAFALARLLRSFLYDVAPADPVALFSAAAVLLAAGVVAAGIPALRAARSDPAAVLKES